MNESFCEPWELRQDKIYVAGGYPIEELSNSHLRRIVACVNACAGLSTPQLESIDSVMARVLPPDDDQVSQNPQQGGSGEEARAQLTGAAAGKAPRSVAMPADIEETIERVLVKYGILQPVRAEAGAR